MSISGQVIDQNGEPLVGATIMIEDKENGAITDVQGRFEISTTESFPFTIVCSYIGFNPVSVLIESNRDDLNIVLGESLFLFDNVVISASRRREKIQEAPASISVITSRNLEASPNENPIRNLVNEPGIVLQQQTAGRINLHLRGDDGLVFGSASFPMLDYRPLALSGDISNNVGYVNNLDLERIEVVRGPGSALYGPGVTAGVIHFISKSAIDRPGSAIELIGGELNTFGISVRHATKVSDKFGFKINAVYKRGDEFTLDVDDPIDALQIAKFQNTVSVPAITNGTVDPSLPSRQLLGPEDLDPDGDGNPMQDFWRTYFFNGTMEFRPQHDLSMILSGGIESSTSIFYSASGEGLFQGPMSWVQARVQKGGLFGQIVYSNASRGSDENPILLYQTGNSVGNGGYNRWIESQVQYSFDTPKFLNSQWTTGLDYRLLLSDTRNLQNGRQEDDDNYRIFGGYLQTRLELAKKLDLVLVGRVDRFNFVSKTTFAPRAVLVWKPHPKHTFRAGFNRAVGAPTQLEVFADIPVVNIIPGAFDIWLNGTKDAQTFGDNPQIVFNGTLPFPSLPVGTPGLPLAYVQGAVSELIIPALTSAFAGDPNLADHISAISAYLGNPANFVGGFGGTFLGINLFNGLPLGVLDAPSAKLRIEDTWEIGYKGLIGEKLGLSVDIFNRNIDGFALYTALSPSYTLLNADEIPTALGNAVGSDFAIFLSDLLSSSIPDEAERQATVDAVSSIVGNAYGQGGAGFIDAIRPLIDGVILAATPTEQAPDDGVTHVVSGFRTFEPYNYWGTDVGLSYYLKDDLTFFGSFSWISETLFTPKIADVDGTETLTSLRPAYNFRLGMNYVPENGIRANLSFQHDPSFNVLLGQYTGLTDERNLIDLGIGYKFDNGLNIDISAQNLFNNEYRTYPNFPKIGRRILGKVTYTFGN